MNNEKTIISRWETKDIRTNVERRVAPTMESDLLGQFTNMYVGKTITSWSNNQYVCDSISNFQILGYPTFDPLTEGTWVPSTEPVIKTSSPECTDQLGGEQKHCSGGQNVLSKFQVRRFPSDPEEGWGTGGRQQIPVKFDLVYNALDPLEDPQTFTRIGVSDNGLVDLQQRYVVEHNVCGITAACILDCPYP